MPAGSQNGSGVEYLHAHYRSQNPACLLGTTPRRPTSSTGLYHDAKQATWRTPADIKNVYRNVSFVGNNRAVFNFKGNQYRLVVTIQYQYGIP
jgi:mRNA-degrading endonuclease HigB of HigAB toxin-antitoxin module